MESVWKSIKYLIEYNQYWVSDASDSHELHLLKFTPQQKGYHFADYILEYIFLLCIMIQISLNFAPECLICNKAAMILAVAWQQEGNKWFDEKLSVCHINPEQNLLSQGRSPLHQHIQLYS